MSESKIYYLKSPILDNEANRILRREVSELLGLCRGIIADGVVSPEEVQFLTNWLATHPMACCSFPGSAIVARLQRIYEDGVVTEEERTDLLHLLQDATGQKDIQTVTAPTSLPLDDPPPTVIFGGSTFCFTGKFASGTRSWCQSETTSKGGICLPGINRQLRYLVIGSVGNERWAHSSFGNKIEKAISLKEGGANLSIIEEEHWLKAIQGSAS
jgi:NAD-dependent DNA ligase